MALVIKGFVTVEEEERLKAKKIKEDKEFTQFLLWGGVVIVVIILILNETF